MRVMFRNVGHNSQLLKGNKTELAERCADCEVFGCLPRCTECMPVCGWNPISRA